MDLPEDCVMEILSRLDPLARTLFGMTCATHSRMVKKWRDWHPVKQLTNIWSILEAHGAISLFQWALGVWHEDLRYDRSTWIALKAHNFELATWLVENVSYTITGFYIAMDVRDFDVMDWCYVHGYVPTAGMKKEAEASRDPKLIQWFEGKKIRPSEQVVT